MNAIDILRNEYPGDDVWQEFVNLFLPEWELLPDKNLYLSMVNDRGIAMFLAIHMGQNSFDWLSSPCNALDKKNLVML